MRPWWWTSLSLRVALGNTLALDSGHRRKPLLSDAVLAYIQDLLYFLSFNLSQEYLQGNSTIYLWSG